MTLTPSTKWVAKENLQILNIWIPEIQANIDLILRNVLTNHRFKVGGWYPSLVYKIISTLKDDSIESRQPFRRRSLCKWIEFICRAISAKSLAWCFGWCTAIDCRCRCRFSFNTLFSNIRRIYNVDSSFINNMTSTIWHILNYFNNMQFMQRAVLSPWPQSKLCLTLWYFGLFFGPVLLGFGCGRIGQL